MVSISIPFGKYCNHKIGSSSPALWWTSRNLWDHHLVIASIWQKRISPHHFQTSRLPTCHNATLSHRETERDAEWVIVLHLFHPPELFWHQKRWVLWKKKACANFKLHKCVLKKSIQIDICHHLSWCKYASTKKKWSLAIGFEDSC